MTNDDYDDYGSGINDALLQQVKTLQAKVASLEKQISDIIYTQTTGSKLSTAWMDDPKSLGSIAGTLANKLPTV